MSETQKADTTDRFSLDWRGLMRAGLKGLGLRPAEFWALTPVELMVMLGREGGQTGALTRDGLNALLASYPDTPVDTPSIPVRDGETHG